MQNKKAGIFCLAVLATVFAGTPGLNAQQMNEAGHFISGSTEELSYKLNEKKGESEIELGSMRLKGSSVFKTQYGFITLSGNDENAPSVLRQYSEGGEELFSKSFPQTINFTLSNAKNFCAFHDKKQICVIDLATHRITTIQGPVVFALNDAGEVAFFDEGAAEIRFMGLSAAIAEPVYRVLFFKEQALFVTRSSILQLTNGGSGTVFKPTEGRIFDLAVIGDKLFVSVKKELLEEFIFTSFSSSDLLLFIPGEEKHYPLKNPARNSAQKKSAKSKEGILGKEIIYDPLYYGIDTAYQPVGNGYNEIQEYTIGSPYPHPGVDLLGTNQQNVYSVKKGYVKAILTTSAQYHWRAAIANLNTALYSPGYLYAHLDQPTIPYAVGDSVSEGAVIGKLVDFPVAGFVHCHFARIGDIGNTWSGDWWTFDNPLAYMSNFFDSIAPQFEKTTGSDVFAFRDSAGTYLAAGNLHGKVKVISKVYDRVNSAWHIDVHKLRYSVSPLASPQTLLLDSASFTYNYFNDFYSAGPYYSELLNIIYSRDTTCHSTADYNVRDYYHIVTNNDGNDTLDSNDSLQFFNTLALANGSYIFRVRAFDPAGNSGVDSMIIQIYNPGAGVPDSDSPYGISIAPNPFSSQTTLRTGHFLQGATLSVYNSLGLQVKRLENLSGSLLILHREELAAGLYFFRLEENNKMSCSGKLLIADK